MNIFKRKKKGYADTFAFKKMIVGLGNPGRKYNNNRHNIGFMVIDAFAEMLGCTPDQKMGKALYCKAMLKNEKLLLAKPQSYMNLSGEPVQWLVNYFKVSSNDLIVVYDDLDLPLGKIRIREKGSTGGHKGLTSIIKHVANDNVVRIRVGIDRPPDYMDASSYVLSKFTKEESEQLSQIIRTCCEAIECLIFEGIVTAMNKFN